MKLYGPIVSQAVDQFPSALAELGADDDAEAIGRTAEQLRAPLSVEVVEASLVRVPDMSPASLTSPVSSRPRRTARSPSATKPWRDG